MGDAPARVEANRARLQQVAGIPGTLNWLNQVHGIAVHPVSDRYERAPDADAACAREAGQACIVMTADCLPVLFCDRAGTVVAAAHAGWRGLLGGVLEASIAAMGCEPGEILAWLGPAIGPAAFEVGGEVREAFMTEQAEAAAAFVPSLNEGKWLADIYQLARLRLARAGVTAIYGGEYCTFSDSERFYPIAATGRRVAWPPLCGWKNSRRGAREWPQAPLHSLVMALWRPCLAAEQAQGAGCHCEVVFPRSPLLRKK